MGQARKFAQNSFWLAASTTTVIFVGAAYRPIIGRILGPTEYGQYSFITAFVSYFVIFAYFGVRQVVMRETGRDPGVARAFLLASYKLRAVTTLLAILACCTVGYALGREPQVTLGIFIMSLSVAITGIGELLEGTLIAFSRSFYIAVSSVVSNVLKLILGIWALEAGYGLIGVLWVFVITSVVTTLMNWHFTRLALGSEKQSHDELAHVRYVLKESFPFFILSISTRLYAKSDILILTLLRGDMVTGLYSAAYVFLDLLFAIASSITATAYPVITRLYTSKDDNSRGNNLAEAYERLHKYMVLTFIPISASLMLAGGDILLLLFGKDFSGGIPVLGVLVWTAPIGLSSNISGTFLSAIYRQRLNAVLAGVGTVVNIAWTIVFIILYGAMGAAVATLGAAAVNSAVHQFFVMRTIGKVNLINIWIKPLLCGAIMVAVMMIIPHFFWIWKILVGLVSYAAAIAVIKPYDKEDQRLLVSVLRR